MAFILALLSCLAIALPAHAYLDPGSGSYMFQMVIAAMVGGLFSLKLFWHNLVGFFSGILKKKNQNE